MSKWRDLLLVLKGELSSKLCAEHDAYIAEQNHTIREMDQLIYDMSQKSSWETMRPLFNVLQAGQEYRMKQESKRIGHIVIKEIERAYS